MEHYLCLTDLLDQDLSAYEYFQTLPPAVQTALRREDGGIGTLDELQARGGPFAGLTFNRIEPTLSAGVFAGGKMEDAGTMA